MPNALLEAAAAGLPLVALPASDGLVDLLRDKTGTWIGPSASVESLTSTLLEALNVLKSGERFEYPWIEQFQIRRALAAYEKLIDETIGAWQL